MSSRKRRQELPVDTSWRMVEGEHDSFDTSLIFPDDLLDEEIPPSSGPSQQLSNLSQLSQLSSQSNDDWRIGGSQDTSTIHDFINQADDERVILRSPFPPSVPGAVRQSPRTRRTQRKEGRSPEPEFKMPRIDVDSPRRASSSASARTVRPGDEQNVRQRTRMGRDATKTRSPAPKSLFAESGPPTIGERMSSDIPQALYSVLGWCFGVLGMAFRFAQKPLAVALALYLVFGGLILASNWLTRSFYVAISPVCNIPGLAYFVDFPFCTPDPSGARGSSQPIEFDSLMSVEGAFEQVYEKSATGVSLPIEMKRSETAIRDLRTMVKFSKLQGKEDLVAQFTDFINAAGKASDDLQAFNVHVGSAVDAVININKWTVRYLDGLVAAEKESHNLMMDLITKVFSPFQPAVYSERSLSDKYVELTALVAIKIEDLIEEAQSVQATLVAAQDHLNNIQDFVFRTRGDVTGQQKGGIWEALLTLVRANAGQRAAITDQLRLLGKVDAQRNTALVRVTELIRDLKTMKLELQELRDHAKAPELSDAQHGPLTLDYHIDTINAGVDRLQVARRRIRDIEGDRVKEALIRGKEAQRQIEAS